MTELEIYNLRVLPRRIIDANNCWIYTGHINKHGYGTIRVQVTSFLVHRLSAIANLGPSNLNTLHKLECKSKACFNPEHLYYGTQLENVRDARLDGSFQKTRKLLTHCRRGHELNETNLGTYKGFRYCKACKSLRRRKK